MLFALPLIRHFSCTRYPAHLESPTSIVRRRGIIFCKPGATSATVRKTLVSAEVLRRADCGIALVSGLEVLDA